MAKQLCFPTDFRRKLINRTLPSIPLAIHVLYIHHSGAFGGASRSLLEMIGALPAGEVIPHLITPKGTVAEMALQQGIPVIESGGIAQFDCTRFGYYHGLRWLILLRELWYIPHTVIAMLRAKFLWSGIDLVHVNELTALLAIVLAKVIFGKPVIVHVRSVQKSEGIVLRRRLRDFVVRRCVQRVVAIDETVRRCLPESFHAEVVHNGLALRRISVNGSQSTVEFLSGDRFKVAMVGNLLPMKGVYEFADAARICAARGLDIDFVIVGDNVRTLTGIFGWLIKCLGLAKDVKADINAFVEKHALQGRIHLLGFTPDIQSVYERISVLCFPSDLDAAGRPVFEAAFFHVPSIVAIDHPPNDAVIDGETGLRIKPKDANSLANAIEYLYRNPQERKRLGERAFAIATENFDIHTNAARMFEIYCASIDHFFPLTGNA